MNGDVGIYVKERRRSEAAKTVEASKDLIEDDWKASPRGGTARGFLDGRVWLAEEVWRFANNIDEGALEERIPARSELAIDFPCLINCQ